MSFWWVNHNKTFSAEMDGGYIWSPKTNINGAHNQTYTNLTLTRPRDIVFSYGLRNIQAIGVVSSHYREQTKPSEFGKAGDGWLKTGWVVPIDWVELVSPISPKDYLDQILPLLPTKNSPINRKGNGNQCCYLAAISEGFGNLLISIAHRNNPTLIFVENQEITNIAARSGKEPA